jgi:hypothetical protein
MSGTFASSGSQGALLWLVVLGFVSTLAVLYRRDSNRAKRDERAAIEDHEGETEP